LAFAAIVGVVKMRTTTTPPQVVDEKTAQVGNIQQPNNSNAVAQASPDRASAAIPEDKLPARNAPKYFVAVSYKKPAPASTSPQVAK